MISIIAPCYNEKENIAIFITSIFQALEMNNIAGELILVDDNSPDGTGEIAAGMREQYNNLKVYTRKGQKSLSSAVVKGFEMAEGEIMVVMDADLSHPPQAIPRLIEPIKQGNCEMAIASRYINGGKAMYWPLRRRLTSKAAILLARLVSGIKDPNSGFFALRRGVLEGVRLKPRGQKIGLEIIAKGNYNNISEVSYTFRERKFGKSKLTVKVMKDNIIQTLSLIFAKNSCLRRLLPG